MAPAVTVGISTYGRGVAILPTLRSVQLQTMADFEALVIGDADPSDAAAAVASLADPRFRFINLEERWKTQSGPNNRAIEEARAPIVALLGHDDLWMPNHLAAITATFAARPDLGYVVSGMALYLDVHPMARILGIFDGTVTEFNRRTFASPSAMAFRVDTPLLPRWRRREEVGSAVDIDFMMRALAAGIRLGSTGVATVCKWSAASRYLVYVSPSADEQEEALEAILAGRWQQRMDQAIASAKARGRFMETEPGREFKIRTAKVQRQATQSDMSRGLILPEARQVRSGARAAQTDERRGRDWLGVDGEGDARVRWNGSMRPKLYLPFLNDGPCRIAIDVRFPDAEPPRLGVRVEGEPVQHALADVRPVDGGPRVAATLGFEARLRTDRGTVVTLALPPERAREGIAVGLMRAEPLEQRGWFER